MKTNYIFLRVVFTVIFITLLACQDIDIKSTNADKEHLHYSPSGNFEYLDIEFDYPNSWILKEVAKYPGVDLVTLVDPETEDAMISIGVYLIENGQTAEMKAKLFAQRSSEAITVKISREYESSLKGHKCFVVETQFGPIDDFSKLMYGKTLFFSIEDKIYDINLRLANEDRDGDFEKGYEYLLKSIRIVP